MLFTANLFAEWNNYVTNYKKELFGKGSQTWQINAFNENWVYFANKNGLLQYEGSSWRLYPLHNEADVRSLHISTKLKRIYVGGEGEFGYFHADASGKLLYVNLSDSLPAQSKFNVGYWGVFEVDNIFYFVSDNFIVKQLGDEFTLIPSVHKIDRSNVVNGSLYIGTYKGVFVLVGNSFFPLSGGELLEGKHIRSIEPYQSGMLIATAVDGLFYAENGKVTPLITGAEQFMRENEVFTMAVSGDYIAIGTVRRGLVLVNRRSRLIKYFNERNGLQNNTVLSISFDKRNNLWLGLDNGIDYISLDTPFTNLYTYPYSSGAGYASVLFQGKLYLGTNSGVYHTSWPVRFTETSAAIDFIPQLSGQVWDMRIIDGKLFCMHDKGLFILDGKSIEQVSGLRGVWSCVPHYTDPDKLWVGTYEGLYLIQHMQGKWQVLKELEGISDWFKNFEFESSEVLWVRNTNEGALRVVLDTVNYKVKSSRFYTSRDGLKSIRNLFISKLENKLYFSSDSGLFEYDKAADRMIPNRTIPVAFPHSVLKKGRTDLYGLSRNGLGILKKNRTGDKMFSVIYPFNHKQLDFIKYYENFEIIGDSVVIIPNEHGFSLLDLAFKEKVETGNELFIKSVYSTYPKDSLLFNANFTGNSYVPEIPYSQNSLRFEYTMHAFDLEKVVRYRFMLSPATEWSEYTTSEVKEYSGLKEGSYTFRVEALMNDGKVSSATFSFVILPPWYRSMWAYFVYFLLLMAFLYFLYQWDEWRIKRKKQQEVAIKEKEMWLKEQDFIKAAARQENEIISLKNERLEYELRHKSQEMANLMMNFVRKNEILMDIKSELYKIMAELKSDSDVRAKRMLVTLNNSIDTNMQSDDLLKRFEEQFDLVHNNFMAKLSEKHPDLSVNERKMCAFLKMNLSSKEIAPLLNLSVRGVETLRYRLRKKIGLEREENLLEYLNAIDI